jgi:hypothetical protein
MEIIMTQTELLAELQSLKAQNEILKAKVEARKKNGTLSLKISTKFAVSLYGLGRFPTTLYASQWVRLLERKADILAFIEANKDQLSSKEEKVA